MGTCERDGRFVRQRAFLIVGRNARNEMQNKAGGKQSEEGEPKRICVDPAAKAPAPLTRVLRAPLRMGDAFLNQEYAENDEQGQLQDGGLPVDEYRVEVPVVRKRPNGKCAA